MPRPDKIAVIKQAIAMTLESEYVMEVLDYPNMIRSCLEKILMDDEAASHCFRAGEIVHMAGGIMPLESIDEDNDDELVDDPTIRFLVHLTRKTHQIWNAHVPDRLRELGVDGEDLIHIRTFKGFTDVVAAVGHTIKNLAMIEGDADDSN